jgi:hypothetical protein
MRILFRRVTFDTQGSHSIARMPRTSDIDIEGVTMYDGDLLQTIRAAD